MRTILFFPFLLSGLAACNNSATPSAGTGTASTTAAATNPTAGGDLAVGTYHAYQLSGAGFGFQYKFELLNDHEYTMYDKPGAFTFEPSSNAIRFTSGPIQGFRGVFTRVNHVNDARKLMIVIDFQSGSVPDTLHLDRKPGGYYQYAYFQP